MNALTVNPQMNCAPHLLQIYCILCSMIDSSVDPPPSPPPPPPFPFPPLWPCSTACTPLKVEEVTMLGRVKCITDKVRRGGGRGGGGGGWGAPSCSSQRGV